MGISSRISICRTDRSTWGTCRSPGRSPPARETDSPIAQWSAYFTPDVSSEAIADFLLALDARDQPTEPLADPDTVLDTVAAQGWIRDIGDPPQAAMDPMFTSYISLGEVPPLIQDVDPRLLFAQAGEADEAGPMGWQAWCTPALGAPCLWAVSFSAGVPHDLVAAFAASLSSTTPVLRRVIPEATSAHLLRAPAV